MKILITGGSGVIGSALIRYLLKNFNTYQILNVDKLTYASNDSLNQFEKNENYDHKKVDILDKINLREIFFDFKPDFVKLKKRRN